ncbi:MAG: patatin-like phospholipase family protein, partial [Bacteroidetes bacterium]|nr:patatin-like phospholipase family protein [Bacteroidota bacterium]
MKIIYNFYGGGSRGIATAHFMDLMKMPKADMCSGTSVGGIIAIAKAYGYTNKEILEFFEKHLSGIFKKKIRYLFHPILKARYSERYFEDCLKEYFGNAPLSKLKTEIFIPAHEWMTNITFWFKNNKPYTCFDAARATSAATSYFKPYKLGSMVLVDAGPYVNNPVIWSLIHAWELWPDEDFQFISIGTGRTGGNHRTPQINALIIDDVIRMGINGSEGLGHRGMTTISKILPKVHYTYYDFDIPSSMKLDDTDPKSIKILKAAAEKE